MGRFALTRSYTLQIWIPEIVTKMEILLSYDLVNNVSCLITFIVISPLIILMTVMSDVRDDLQILE